jgi:hypothetical protein
MAPIPRARSVGPGHTGLAADDAAVADPVAGELVRHRPTHRVRRPPPLGEHIHHVLPAPSDLNAQVPLRTTPAWGIKSRSSSAYDLALTASPRPRSGPPRAYSPGPAGG